MDDLSSDILFNIAVKLDNSILESLFKSTLRERISVLLRSQLFWRRRCEHLVKRELEDRPGTDWRRVYAALDEAEKKFVALETAWIPFGEKTKKVFDVEVRDMPTLLILEDVHKAPATVEWMTAEKIYSPEVLDYLVRTRGYDKSYWFFEQGLATHASEGNTVMVDAVLRYIPTGPTDESLRKAAKGGHLELLKSLLHLARKRLFGAGRDQEQLTDRLLSALLSDAALYDRADVVRFLLERFEYHFQTRPYEASSAIDVAIRRVFIATLDVLSERFYVSWLEALERAIELDKIDAIRQIFARFKSNETFDVGMSLALKSEKVPPSIPILAQIQRKHLTSGELMDWMIGLDNETIAETAASILDSSLGYGSGAASVRALLLAMLYPTLTLEGLVDHITEEGYTNEEISDSIELVNAMRTRA